MTGVTTGRVGRARRVRVTLATVLLMAVGGCGSDDAVDRHAAPTKPLTTEPAVTTGVPAGPWQDDTTLPIGDDDSPYWVAHDLPDGYALSDARISDSSPFGGTGTSSNTTGYGPSGKGRDDADLWLATMEFDAPDSFWEGAAAEAERDEAFELVTVPCKDGFEYPLSGDGRDYGTTLAWEERPGLWITVEAAEPLTRDDAYAVAEGLKPFPEEQWDDLLLGLDSGWAWEAGAFDTADIVRVGQDDAGVHAVQVDALLPPQWHDVPVERRLPCARLTVDDAAMAEPACNRTHWYLRDGDTYLAGVVDGELDGATVEIVGRDRSVDAMLFPDPDGRPITYWIAALGDAGCTEYLVALDHADDDLDTDDPGALLNGGPEGGCGAGMPPGEPVIEGLPPDSATIPAG